MKDFSDHAMSLDYEGPVHLKLDELTNLRLIKSGGYGLIYRANHVRFGIVAYKEIKVETVDSYEA